jgi:hypothetical protein
VLQNGSVLAFILMKKSPIVFPSVTGIEILEEELTGSNFRAYWNMAGNHKLVASLGNLKPECDKKARWGTTAVK